MKWDILVVEDNEPDRVFLRITLEETPHTLHMVKDGAEALRYLRREDEYATAERPDLVLLDINMPGMSGHEVLEAIKQDPATEGIPVVMLTTSKADEDVDKALMNAADAYVCKPLELEEFEQVTATLR